MPFLMQGYYSNSLTSCAGTDANSSVSATCFNLSDIATQGELGYTVVMYYSWMGIHRNQQQLLLDSLAANNMMLLVDLTHKMEDIACGGTAGDPNSNCTKDPAALADAWAAVERQISRWKSHPGVLGWYVCDDCFSQYLMRQVEAGTPSLDRYYAKIKAIDPAHIIVGANNADINYAFTHASELAPRPSLDVVMEEDYAEELAECHAVPDGHPCAPTTLWPATFEAQVNSPGPFMIDKDKSLHTEYDRARVMEGMAWISTLARVPQQLYFRRRYVGAQAMQTLGQFSRNVVALSRFTVPSTVGMYDGTTIEVSTQSVRVGLLVDTSEDSLCALAVAVNLNSSHTSFEVNIGVGRRTVGADLTALRYDQANRSMALTLRKHTLEFADVLDARTTGLYIVCGHDRRTNGVQKPVKHDDDDYDVVVYGATSGGVVAAVAAVHAGALRVALLDPGSRIGGMTAGGLSSTDTGDAKVIGGMAKQFYLDNGHHYNLSQPEYMLEPHVALQIFQRMVADANITLFSNEAVETVSKTGARITSLTTVEGRMFRAEIFIEADCKDR
jgi:hypothetical protein